MGGSDKVVAEVLAKVVEDFNKEAVKGQGEAFISDHEITLAAISTMTDYLLSDHTTSEGILRSIFILEAIKGKPITIYRVEIDAIGGYRPRHKEKWLALREHKDEDGAKYQYTIGFGGDYRAIKSDYGGSDPLIGLTLYPFNIENYWVFLPTPDSEFYGIVNHTNNTLFEGGW